MAMMVSMATIARSVAAAIRLSRVSAVAGVVLGSLAGCSQGSRSGSYVGDWGNRDDSLVVHRNGLAEGRLFGESRTRSFTWRADGPAMLLTFGRVARDTVEYRGTLDDEGHLVLESAVGKCVLERAGAARP